MNVHRLLNSIACCLALSGCAHIRTDDDGTQHIVGLVCLTLPPPDSFAERGADTVRIRSLGLTALRSPANGGVVLGYQETTLITVRNNSLVLLKDALPDSGSPSANRDRGPNP